MDDIFSEDDFDMVPCPVCGCETEKIRIKMGKNCKNCNSGEAPMLGAVEGSAKSQVVHLVRQGSEEARRAFNSGKCVVRRNTPPATLARKQSQGGY